jgi:hypothetical protein
MLIEKVQYYSKYNGIGGTFEFNNPKTGRYICLAELVCGDNHTKHTLNWRQASHKHGLTFEALFFVTAKFNEVIEASKKKEAEELEHVEATE